MLRLYLLWLCSFFYQPDPPILPPQPTINDKDPPKVTPSAQQAYEVRQPHHEDPYAHQGMEQVAPGFPLRTNPPNNPYFQGYGYQPSPVYITAPEQVQGNSQSPPSNHAPKQGAQCEEDDDLPPPILPPSRQMAPQSHSPVKVRAASGQPHGSPHQQPQPPGRYAHTNVDIPNYGPQVYNNPHYQRGWQQAVDAQGFVNPQPRLGTSVPQSHWPVQRSPYVMSNAQLNCLGGEISSVYTPPDPFLRCPICQNAFRKGDIENYERHIQICGQWSQL